MKPSFGRTADMSIFEKYISKAKYYAEYGSGGSTYCAALKDNVIKLYSVESDKKWTEQLYSEIPNNVHHKCSLLCIDIDAGAKKFGYPGPKSNINQWINYNNALNINLKEDEKKQIDLILIDGRFRVASILNCLNFMNEDTIVLFDDFNNRKHYHIVLDFFDIIEKGAKMVVLKKKYTAGKYERKKLMKKCNELIKKYQTDPR